MASWTRNALRASVAGAVAVALLATARSTSAQRWERRGTTDQPAEEVFRALERNRGSGAYFDAMEAATDELRGHGLIPSAIERHYDRMARRPARPGDLAGERWHERIMETLDRNRYTEAYYDAMEAASDELEDAGLVSGASAEFFDRMAAQAGWGGYGYWRGGYPFDGGGRDWR